MNSTQNPDGREVKKTERKGLKEICNGSTDDHKVSDDLSVKEVKRRKRKNKDRRQEVDDGKLQGEEVQNVVKNNDVKGKKKGKGKDKVKTVKETGRVEARTINILNKEVEPELPLPQGIPLTSVLGIELPPEDAGNALQFLEFCSAFGEVI